MSQRNPMLEPVSGPSRRRRRAPIAGAEGRAHARLRAGHTATPRRNRQHAGRRRARAQGARGAHLERDVAARARGAPRPRGHRQPLHDDLGQAREGPLPPAPPSHVPRRQRRHRARPRPLRRAQRSRRLAAPGAVHRRQPSQDPPRAPPPPDGVHHRDARRGPRSARDLRRPQPRATSPAASTRASPGASARSRAPSGAGATRSRWARTASKIA